MLEKEQAKHKVREMERRRNAQFLVSRGDDPSKKENSKYILNFIVFSFEERTNEEAEKSWKLFFRRIRIDGAKKRRTTKCKNQKLFLCTRKFIVVFCRENFSLLFFRFGNSRAFDLHSTKL
jgi:hypothetical protein